MLSNKKHRLIAGLSLNKLADLLISAKTTLPALMLSIGAPTWMVGWLVPIRESGALLPQALLSFYLRGHSKRHIVWRAGMIIQTLSVACILLALFMSSSGATNSAVSGAIVLIALVLLSLGRSACSLTVKDMEADVAEKGERGNLIGMASTISGVATLAVALPLLLVSEALDKRMLMGIIGFSASVFALTLVCMWPIKTDVSVGKDSDSNTSVFSVNFDSTVYKFIFVRGLFVHSALVAPYFMIQKEESAANLLPIYIAAEALATLLSSLIWGKVADKSARLTLQIAGAMALVACIGLLVSNSESLVLSAALFFVLSIAHAGVRTGRKTYSLDVKEGHERTELVGFSNTSIGLILLAFGSLYAALTPVLTFSVVYVMAAMIALAIVTTLILPKEK
ncbi:MFS transporter [Alteromonas gracilis]|uniref:MFS transporter n=1 Tax=Alteromonas gracilis TaxID=1479524 RepID=UPI0030D38C0C